MSEQSLSTKEQLLGRNKRRYCYVDIPETGDRVRVQSLTEKERSEYELSTRNSTGKKFDAALESSRRRLIVLVCVDESGHRIFADTDIAFVEAMDNTVTSAIFEAAWLHCGFARRAIEAEAKNSDGAAANGQSGGSQEGVANQTSTSSSTA